MARLAYIAHGLRGSLYNTLALLRLLDGRGHTIQLLSHRDIGADAAASGIEFVRLVDGIHARDEVSNLVESRGRLRSLPRALRLRRGVIHSREVTRRIDGFEPDLTLVDAEMHGAVLRCCAAGTRIATVVPWHSVFHESGLPPMHTELTPDSERAQIEASWASLHRRRRVAWTIGRLDPRKLPERMVPFPANSPDPVAVSAIARSAGVSLRRTTSRLEWMHPHVFHTAPMLSYTARELDFATRPPSSFHYLGPVIDPQRPEPLVSGDARAQLRAFVAEAASAGRRLVYCSMGSLQPATLEYYEVVRAAFADRPDWSLVIGLGGQGGRGGLGGGLDRSAGNVLVLDYAPQLEAIRAAAVVVHTGGTGTMYECLRYAVPSIVRHTGHLDMPGIAARTEHLGLGRALSPVEFVPETLRAAATELVADGAILGSLDRVQAVLERYETDGIAARTVEALIDGPGHDVGTARPRSGACS